MICQLKCDANGCDHREAVQDLTEEMIGRPCPKCGSNLLTREDYEDGLRVKAAFELLISLGVVGTWEDPRLDPEKEYVPININMHAGETNIKVGNPVAASKLNLGER